MSNLSSGSRLKLLAIVGATASGKTSLAIEIARKYNGEIICADSRTVYRGMNIGTAKPTQAEQAAAMHHLLDVVNPDEAFTVADFKKLAEEAVQEVTVHGKLPIVVGGSGLYVDALLYDFSFSDSTSRDPENPRHSDPTVAKSRKPLREGTFILGLNPEREVVRERIRERVEQMVADGFTDEVRNLLAKYPNEKAVQAPGYKAFKEYIDGDISLDEAKQRFVINDSQLAKRQVTWFKRNPDIHWFENAEDAGQFIDSLLASQD